MAGESKRAAESSEEDSDSEETQETRVLQECYMEADIGGGLSRREHFCEAAAELTLLFRCGYQASNKAVQQLVRADVLQAVQAYRLWSGREMMKSALDALVKEASRVLPAAQRAELQRHYKAACVAARRMEKRTDTNDPEVPSAFVHLPEEVLEVILQHLDPLSLACAACVSRDWAGVAVRDHLWKPHFQAFLSQQPSGAWTLLRAFDLFKLEPLEDSPYLQRFKTVIAANPDMLYWRSNRARVNRRLEWLSSTGAAPSHLTHVRYMTPRMVHAHIVGMANRKAQGGPSSDSDDDDQEKAAASRFWKV
ncbi:hypothetical protein WJX72_001589 [[Myrmecia] bisecta]|uniref:F-box domain-containing protein n=1 Tax=[Myrmecia] bisecta TaxID=41462 RepID=A0AAW1PXU7_9CHLO